MLHIYKNILLFTGGDLKKYTQQLKGGEIVNA